MTKHSKDGKLTLTLTLDERQSAFLRGQALCYELPEEALAQLALREWITNRITQLPTIILGK